MTEKSINDRLLRVLHEIHECGQIMRTSLNTRTAARLEELRLIEVYDSNSWNAANSKRPKQARFVRLSDAGRAAIGRKAA
jgi:hypothetical protein